MKTFLKMFVAILAFLTVPVATFYELHGAVPLGILPPEPVTNITANASTVARMTPILQAQDRYRQFALSQVVQGMRRLYSDGGIDELKPSRTIAIVAGDGADRVMRDIMKTELYFTPGGTNWVNDEVTLFDANGRSICDGYGQVRPSDFKSSNIPQVNVYQATVFTGLSEARIQTVEDGVPWSYAFYLENGRLRLPQWFVNRSNATLAVKFQDTGESFTIPLGGAVKTAPMPAKRNRLFDGHYLYFDGEKTMTISEVWSVPTAYVEKAGPMIIDVVARYWDQSGFERLERPTRMICEPEKGKKHEFALSSTRPSTCMVPAQSEVRFEFEHFGQPSSIYIGGGKGDIGPTKN